MFTEGQKTRMYSFLYGDPVRFGLFNSQAGCNGVGINETASFDKYFSIYPNPSDGIVNVNYFGTQNANMIIEVIDITGKVVDSYLTSAYNYTIDLSHLASGSYTMKITGDGGVVTKKLILQ
jgi:hypothetical protein